MSNENRTTDGIPHYAAWVERDGAGWIIRVDGIGATQANSRSKVWKMVVDLILEMDDLAVGEYTLALNFSAEA